MAINYSIETCKKLESAFEEAGLCRPMRISHYDGGTELEYDITPVSPGPEATVKLVIKKFVGGGFAGQVYNVKLLTITVDGTETDQFMDLSVGASYAMKILIPPSGGSLLFRNFLYAVGFQAPFQLQVNPTASRAGALWQKFIRAAAQHRFGDDQCVNDIHATFVDSTLGSCGEISDWVDGRTWRLEVDDHVDTLKEWKKGKTVDESTLASPEYRSKYTFMTEFVKLLGELGAHEFARQYEWTTAKSQPNALKRSETNDDPTAGLIAVDFRAGLALLPFLPMSPGDFKLIWKGLKRGSLVQFDRGNLDILEKHIADHPEMYESLPDRTEMLAELKTCEKVYRDSIPDITHNHVRLLYDGGLWKTLFDSAVTGWKTRNLMDDGMEQVFRRSKFKTLLFFMLGLIPILGRVGRKIWARADWRRHYGQILVNLNYFGRAFRGRMAEKLIDWHRAGRVDEAKAIKLSQSVCGYLRHLPLSILPVGLHRLLTDARILKRKMYFLFVRPVKLYFSKSLREQWLRDMVAQGKRKHILSDEDAETILSQLDEPYIQKYLISMVVHLLTIFVTQAVGLIIAVVNWKVRDLTWDEAFAQGVLIMGALQIVPISPGSICRGLYTTILAIRERNFKDYNIALFLSYVKYIGYLAFPIQMTYRYPAMARFMAAHWATDAVHIVPVFGEQGALLEHWVFTVFYNKPLTIRRRMQQVDQVRAGLASRVWHVPVVAVLFAAVLAVGYQLFYTYFGMAPTADNKWFLSFKPFMALMAVVPIAAGAMMTRHAGGLARMKRILAAMIGGVVVGVVFSLMALAFEKSWALEDVQVILPMAWRTLAAAVFCAIGAVIAEVRQKID